MQWTTMAPRHPPKSATATACNNHKSLSTVVPVVLQPKRRHVLTHANLQQGNNKGTGPAWPLPSLNRSLATDEYETEYETVYVTDTGSESQLQGDQQQQGPDVTVQQQLAAAATAAGTAREGAAALHPAEEVIPSSSTRSENSEDYQPEAVAVATTTAAAPSTSSSNAEKNILVPASHATSSRLLPQPLPGAAAGSSGSFWESSASGWVIAMSLLLAVRQGRLRADAERLDVRALQARQHESRVQSKELREKRAQYLKQQEALKEAAAAKRLAESAKRAELEKHQAAIKAAEEERVAREEAERIKARRAAAKKDFEATQGRLEEELAARTARELAILEEEAAKKAAEQAAAHAAATAEAARVAAEARRAAEEAETAARKAAERRAAAKQQMRASSIRFGLELQGKAAAAPAAASTMGRPTALSVSISLYPGGPNAGGGSSSSSSSVIGSKTCVYESIETAVEAASNLAAAAAQQAVNHYAAAVAVTTAAAQQTAIMSGLSVQLPVSSLQQQQQQQQVHSLPTTQQNFAAHDSVADVDVALWKWLLLSRLEGAGRLAIQQVVLLAGSGGLQQDFEAYLHYSALPMSHPLCLHHQLTQAADLAAQNDVAAAVQVLDMVTEWYLEDYITTRPSQQPMSSSGSSVNTANSASLAANLTSWVSAATAADLLPGSVYLIAACVYALLLNTHDESTQQLLEKQSSGSSSAAATPISSGPDSSSDFKTDDLFDALEAANEDSNTASSSPAARTSYSSSGGSNMSIVSNRDSPLQQLVKHQLNQLAKDAPADSLTPVATSLQMLLGWWHPVAAAVLLLAERNMSFAARQAREMKRQQKQLAEATEVLKGSAIAGPGGLDPSDARMRQALVPAPERIWALRNVANSMLRSAVSSSSSGGGGNSAAAEEALGMLQQAADLAADHYGPNHPGQLSALLDQVAALLVVPGHNSEAAAAIQTACNIVVAVGDRYRQQQDLLSLVLLYESAQAELDVPGVLGRDATMQRLQRQAADAFSVLDKAQANLVMSRRKIPPGSPNTALRQLARDCAEELGVYTTTRRRINRLEQWNKRLPLTPLR